MLGHVFGHRGPLARPLGGLADRLLDLGAIEEEITRGSQNPDLVVKILGNLKNHGFLKCFVLHGNWTE